MSFEDGWAAMNLEMPDRVPRSEYAETHWDLVSAVTGIPVHYDSPIDVMRRAWYAFYKAWNYDIQLYPVIGAEELSAMRTNMGHSYYEKGGVDFDDNITSPFKDVEQVLSFDPWEVYGEKDKRELIRRFEDDYHHRVGIARFGGGAGMPLLQPDREGARNVGSMMVNTTGVYITLITGLTYIFGWEMMLLASGTDARRFGDVTNRYASWMQQYYNALAETDVPVVCCHDDIVWASGAIWHPDWYRTYVFPNIRKLWAPLVEAGKKILFICDGNYMDFADDIADCGAHGFYLEPRYMDFGVMAERYGQTHVLIGDVDTRVLLLGTKAEIRAEVERSMAIGKKCPGYFMMVTNAIPANTPTEAALYYNEVYEELSQR